MFFLEQDSKAIEYSKKLAKQAGIMIKQFLLIKVKNDLENVVHDFNPKIVEAIRLLENRLNEKAINLLKNKKFKIYNLLAFHRALKTVIFT